MGSGSTGVDLKHFIFEVDDDDDDAADDADNDDVGG